MIVSNAAYTTIAWFAVLALVYVLHMLVMNKLRVRNWVYYAVTFIYICVALLLFSSFSIVMVKVPWPW